MSSADDPGREARLAEIAEHDARRARLIEQHGEPERISNADALALARTAHVAVSPSATADDWIHASIYRDEAAADGWLESNRVHHGYPTLARVPLPDGRVVGILDLRAELERAREEARREHEKGLTDEQREEADAYHRRIAAGGCRNGDCREQGRPESAVWWECPAGHREEFLYCAAHGPKHLDLFLRDGGLVQCQSCREWMTPRSATQQRAS